MRKTSRRTRYALVAIGIAAIVAIAAAVVTYRQNEEIQRASLRLSEGMKLVIADTDRRTKSNEKWYRVATDHKLAIAVLRTIRGPDSQGRVVGTGFLIDGKSLHHDFRGKTLFITAGHVVSHILEGRFADIEHTDSRDSVKKISAHFPSMSNDARLLFDDLLFYSFDLDYAVLTTRGPIPPHATTLAMNRQKVSAETEIDGIAILHWTGSNGFVLGLGHVLPQPLSLLEPGSQKLRYTHVTEGGASGAPVFSTGTAELLCLHQGVSRDAVPPSGNCTTFDRITADIASKITDREARSRLLQ